MNLDRTIKPVPDSTIDFSLPRIEEFTLNSGMKVSYVHKTNLPIVQMYFSINSGSIYDPADKSGLAYLTSLLIDEGAGGYSTMELDREIEKLGSIINISADQDSLYLSLTCIEEHFTKTLNLGSLILTDPHFDESEFDREKMRHTTKIVQSLDDPSYVASTCFTGSLLKGTQYAHTTLGRKSTVENIANEDVRSFHNKYIVPNNTHLVVVGSISRDKLADELNNNFSDWQPAELETIEDTVGRKLSDKKILFIRKDDAPQSEIRIGHLAGLRNSPDFYAAAVMNSILGGQFSSRINSNLREDKGFTYGANSFFSYYRSAGKFTVSTAVNSENTIETVNEIMKELNGIRAEITEEELEFAKSYMIKRYPANFETFGQIAKNISLIDLYKLPGDYFNTYIQNVNSLSLQNVSDAATGNIFPEQCTILILGNEKLLEGNLEGLSGDISIIDAEGNPAEE